MYKEDFNYEKSFSLHIAILSDDFDKSKKGKIISLINFRALAAVLILVLLSTVICSMSCR